MGLTLTWLDKSFLDFILCISKYAVCAVSLISDAVGGGEFVPDAPPEYDSAQCLTMSLELVSKHTF